MAYYIMVIRIDLAIFRAAYIANSLCDTGRLAAGAGFRLGVAAVAPADAGVRAVAVRFPLAPLMAKGIAVCHAAFHANGLVGAGRRAAEASYRRIVVASCPLTDTAVPSFSDIRELQIVAKGPGIFPFAFGADFSIVAIPFASAMRQRLTVILRMAFRTLINLPMVVSVIILYARRLCRRPFVAHLAFYRAISHCASNAQHQPQRQQAAKQPFFHLFSSP